MAASVMVPYEFSVLATQPAVTVSILRAIVGPIALARSAPAPGNSKLSHSPPQGGRYRHQSRRSAAGKESPMAPDGPVANSQRQPPRRVRIKRMNYTGYALLEQPDTAVRRLRRGVTHGISRGARRVLRMVRPRSRRLPSLGTSWDSGPDSRAGGSGRPAPLAPAPPSLLGSAAVALPPEPNEGVDLRSDRRRQGLR